MCSDVWFEVRVRWWVKWIMHIGCMIAWILRGRARLWWIGILTQAIVPWLFKHGVTTKPMSKPPAAQ